jgi:hypothetical protein
MSETVATTQRTDLDILSDIESLIAQYPPLMKDRHNIDVQVKNGHVTVRGHLLSPNTRRYFLDTLPTIEGVQSINSDALYDDENTRLNIGKILPAGVRLARMYYGIAILAGKLPDGMTADTAAAQIGQLPGVKSVVHSF